MSDQNPYGPPPRDGGHGYPQQPGQSPYGGRQPGRNPYAGRQLGGKPGYGYPQQPGYGYPPPPGSYTGDPSAPYGYDPYGRPYSDKTKIAAGVLQLPAGGLGIGRFYVGDVGIGLAQLFTCGGLGVRSLIDGILILTGNDRTDFQGRVLRS
jgi:hypothetical protein